MREIIEDYPRRDLLELYGNRTNPFSFITTKIDITKAYNYSLKHKNLYAVLCYAFVKAMNQVEAFKYRLEEGQVVKYDVIHPNFTERLDTEDVSFIGFPYKENMDEFIEEYVARKKIFKETQKQVLNEEMPCGEVWLSCLPWFKFTGVVPPFDVNETTPQIIWDKYEITGDKVTINAMIMAHHGFVDGWHIAKLIESINKELDQISED